MGLQMILTKVRLVMKSAKLRYFTSDLQRGHSF